MTLAEASDWLAAFSVEQAEYGDMFAHRARIRRKRALLSGLRPKGMKRRGEQHELGLKTARR
jgi:hypothetical protein